MTVENLQTWADNLEVVRLPEIEAQVSVLQTQQAGTDTLLTQKVQEFQDRLDAHSIRIDVAQTAAEAADARALSAQQNISQTLLDARAYTDFKTDALLGALTGQIAAVTDYIDGDYDVSVDAKIVSAKIDLQNELNNALLEAQSVRDQLQNELTDLTGVAQEILDQTVPQLDTIQNQVLNEVAGLQGQLDLLLVDFAYTNIKASLDDIRAERAALASDIRTEFAAADVVVEQQVTDLEAVIDNPSTGLAAAHAAVNNEASIRQTQDGLLAGRIETLEASAGTQNIIDDPVFDAGDPVGQWTGGTGYGSITSTGVFSGFGFPDELNQTDHLVEQAPVTGAYSETTLRFAGLVAVPSGSNFGASVGIRAIYSDGSPDTVHTQPVASPGDAASRFSVDLVLPAGVSEVAVQLLSGASGDVGSAGHQVHWQDLRVYDVTLINAAISSEAVVRAEADNALASDINTLETTVNGVQASLTTDYLTASETNSAISSAITTLQSEIENPLGTSLGATLANDYLTSVETSAAITSAVSNMRSDIENPEGTSLGATLENSYSTTVEMNSAISVAVTQMKSSMEGPSGSIGQLSASLDQNFYTITEADLAISAATTALKSEIEDPNGTSIGAFLNSNYYTSTGTDSAIAMAGSALKAQIEDPGGTSVGAALRAEEILRASEDSALGSRIDAVVTDLGENTAAITNEQIARSNADSALAADLNAVEATTADLQAYAEANAQAITNINGKMAASYVMRAKAGGAVGEIEIIAADDANNPSAGASSVRIAADNILLDGSVKTSHLAANAVTADKISVTDLSAISANLGTIQVDTANIADLSVGTLKLKDTAVTTGKLSPNSVTELYISSVSGISQTIVVDMVRDGGILTGARLYIGQGDNRPGRVQLKIAGQVVDEALLNDGSGASYEIRLSGVRSVNTGNRNVIVEIVPVNTDGIDFTFGAGSQFHAFGIFA